MGAQPRPGEDIVPDPRTPVVVDPPEALPVATGLEPHELPSDPSIQEKRGEAARRKAQDGQ